MGLLPSRDGIVSAQTDPPGFENILRDSAFAGIEANPHTGMFGRNYHAAIHGQLDCSFAVCTEGLAVLLCLCAPTEGKLGFYGMPLTLMSRQGIDEDTKRAAIDMAFSRLDQIAAAQGPC